jgi:hypothetical protein
MEQPMRHAPNTMTALANAAQTATAYLASKVPVGHGDEDSLTPSLERTQVTDADKSEFLSAYRAVQGGPDRLFDELKAGRRPYSEVAALEAAQPALFKEIQGKLMEQFASAKVKPDYQTRLQLGILFHIPADASMKPDFVQTAQATFAAQAQAQGAPAPGKMPKPQAHSLNTTSTAEATSLPLDKPEQ